MATRSDPNSGLANWTELYAVHGHGHGQGVIMNNAGVIGQPPSTAPDLAAINMASSGSGMTGPAGSPPSHGNSIEVGRVGKSPRRRSRASRRAPVTLLNTDTNNFRAMVQQFTGIPSGPYTSGSLPGSSGASGPTISFGHDFGGPLLPSGGVMSFGQLQPHQYPPRPQPPFQEQVFSSQQQQQQHQYQYGSMFSTGEFGSGGGGNSNNGGDNSMFVDDGMFTGGGMSGTQLMPKVTNSAATNIRGDGFFG